MYLLIKTWKDIPFKILFSRHTARIPCVDGGRDWSGISKSQGMPRIAGSHQKLRERRDLLPLAPNKQPPLRMLSF